MCSVLVKGVLEVLRGYEYACQISKLSPLLSNSYTYTTESKIFINQKAQGCSTLPACALGLSSGLRVNEVLTSMVRLLKCFRFYLKWSFSCHFTILVRCSLNKNLTITLIKIQHKKCYSNDLYACLPWTPVSCGIRFWMCVCIYTLGQNYVCNCWLPWFKAKWKILSDL